MFHEYAVDPEVAASWGEPRSARFFAEAFGIGRGRLLSQCPDDWRRRVFEHFEAEAAKRQGTPKQLGKRELERARLQEVIVSITEAVVVRTLDAWEDNAPWLGNALVEHERFPFHAIVTEHGDASAPIMKECECSFQSEHWAAPRGKVVQRTADDLARIVAPLLCAASSIKFVDPHQTPDTPHRKRVMERLIGVAFGKRPGDYPTAVEIHTCAKPVRSYFAAEWAAFIAPLVPAGQTVSVFRWLEKAGGEKLHNRYVLTELGGVLFGTGLDDASGDLGQTDDAMLLDADQLRKRWSQYSPGSIDFALEDGQPLTVHGIAT